MKNLKDATLLILLCFALAGPVWAGEAQESFEALLAKGKTATDFSQVADMHSAEVNKFANESKSNKKVTLKMLKMFIDTNPKFKSEKVTGDTASLDYKNDHGPVKVKMVREGGQWKFHALGK